ncbi:MAG TPA: hypothetical protein VM681_05390 [Candidatus Thermoplasmatota archaeon]|nr:hypothetical protein [Candidatus Thermoplasmatota archaeon]
MTSISENPQVRVPFRCPRCIAANAVHLVTLSRAGAMNCIGCGTKLRSGDVMRAMIDGRKKTVRGEMARV